MFLFTKSKSPVSSVIGLGSVEVVHRKRGHRGRQPRENRIASTNREQTRLVLGAFLSVESKLREVVVAIYLLFLLALLLTKVASQSL